MKWTPETIKAALLEYYPDGIVRNIWKDHQKVAKAIQLKNPNSTFREAIAKYGVTYQPEIDRGKYFASTVGVYPAVRGVRGMVLPYIIKKMQKKYPQYEKPIIINLALEALRSGEYDEQIYDSLKSRLNHAV